MALRCASIVLFVAAAVSVSASNLHASAADSLAIQSTFNSMHLATSKRQSSFAQLSGILLDPVKVEAPILMNLLGKGQEDEDPAQLPLSVDAVTEDAPGMHLQILSVLLQGLITAVFAYLYVKWRSVPQGAYEPGATSEFKGEWRHQCWTFYEEPGTSFCACCCFPVRWAETMSFVKGLVAFWPALTCMMILCFFLETSVGVFAYLGFVLIGVVYRQEIRRRFDFNKVGGSSYFTDCLMYMCCSCCAIVQEARHVEDALAQEHEATACPADRKRSDRRADCFTQRFFTSDGPSYTKSEQL